MRRRRVAIAGVVVILLAVWAGYFARTTTPSEFYGISLVLSPLGVWFVFVAIVWLNRRRLTRIGQPAVEFIVRYPRTILTVTAGFILGYVTGLAVVMHGIQPAVDGMLKVLFAISSPAEILKDVGAQTGGLAALTDVLKWSGWIAVASWALTVPAIIAIVVEETAETVETGNYLRLSTTALEYVGKYGPNVSALTRAVLSYRKTSGDPAARLALIRQLLLAAASVAQSFVGRKHRASMNASYAAVRKGREFEHPYADVLYDAKRRAGVIDLILHVEQWAIDLPQLDGKIVVMAIDPEDPVAGGPAAIIRNKAQVISNAGDAECWRDAGMNDDQIRQALRYFADVPFHSFISIPIHPPDQPKYAAAVLTVQADSPNAFIGGSDDVRMLLEQLAPFLVLLGSTGPA